MHNAKYVVRRKRADTKQALNDFLLKGFVKSGSCTLREDWGASWDDVDAHINNNSSRCKRYNKQKQSPKNCKSYKKTGKKKLRFVSDDDDDSDYAKTFEVNFGDKCYSWSFRSPKGFGFRSSSTPGFEWKDKSNRTSGRGKPWSSTQKEQAGNSTNYRKGTLDSESDFEDDNNDNYTLRNAGSCSHRITLGLPSTGPLQIHAIKTAFRASALKWHPDKHQGASQAMASEKFKSCVEAYKSLSAAFGAT